MELCRSLRTKSVRLKRQAAEKRVALDGQPEENEETGKITKCKSLCLLSFGIVAGAEPTETLSGETRHGVGPQPAHKTNGLET